MSDLIRRRIDLDPLLFSTGNTHRTPGVHSTDVLRDLLTAASLMKDYSKIGTGGRSREDLDKYSAQGFLWEDIYCEKIAERMRDHWTGATRASQYVRFGEIACPATPDEGPTFIVEYDGAALVTPIPPRYVVLSPDGIRIFPDGSVALAEFKWTTKSGKMNPETEKREWFYQVKSYLYALTQLLGSPITRVEWHVQFAAGDYQGTPPVYEEWEKEFSVAESRDTWTMMISHVDERVRKDPEHKWAQYWGSKGEQR
jgi:hypothetical protein